VQEWNRAVELIEADLAAPVDVSRLARVALTSEYHFRRMFASLAGMPVSEYIRRRKLTAATAEIVAGQGVLVVAVRYGYGSAEAFTRAFKACTGLHPQRHDAPAPCSIPNPSLNSIYESKAAQA
jgi:AraC family transcriptional regulator